MLQLLHEFRHNEGYLLLGIPVRTKMKVPISDFSKSVRKFIVNKFAVEDITKAYSMPWEFHNWVDYLHDNGDEKLRLIQLLVDLDLDDSLKSLDYNRVRDLMTMVENYNMDMKSLILKINEYIMREGLSVYETMRNLNDYNRMSKSMSQKYQKYPKYLLSTHHIVVRNYNAFREYYEEQAFLNMVDKSLAHKGVKYSVLTPEKSQDIKDEGAQQHHCVASYVKSVINGDTQIVFMRDNKNLDKPLLTIEVKDGKVYQAKGTYNRPATEDELKFIHTYANQHNLKVSAHI